MDARVRRRQTFYAVTAQQRRLVVSRHSERSLVIRLAVAVGLVAAAEVVVAALLPSLRSSLVFYLTYSVALIGALFVASLQERRRRLRSTIPSSLTRTPSVDVNPDAEEAPSENRLAA